MTNVHFVGSVALDTPEEVFAAIGQHCGPHLKRVPDGEPGGRRLWICWQIPVLRANPSLAPVGAELVPLKLADGVVPEEVHFGELGYYREARPSYEDFLRAREVGHIPPNVRSESRDDIHRNIRSRRGKCDALAAPQKPSGKSRPPIPGIGRTDFRRCGLKR